MVQLTKQVQMILKFSGGSLTATRDIIIPSKEKLYVMHNATTGSQSLRIKTASSSSTVTIANGKTTVVYCDVTDVFLAITNVPASDISGAVAIANGGTGLTSAGSSNQVLTSNGSAFSLAQLTSSNLYCNRKFTNTCWDYYYFWWYICTYWLSSL